MNDLRHHISHFLTLFGILLAGFAGLILFSYDRKFQEASALATAAGYVAWGIVHHHLHKDLHLEVILEYASVAILGLVIVLTIL